MVHEFLDNKRYLAVLDDVWTQEVWDSIKSVFNDNSTGSRLIVTTRNFDLQTGTPGIRHLMKPLDEQQSRNLFSQKGSIEALNAEFESNLAELLKLCDGLPLAIIVVARELYKERRIEKWDAVYQQLSTLQGPLVQDITNVLALSCDNLPSDLRSCFLHIGFFPPTAEISSEDLIYLWEAEGLLSSSNQESIGNEFLNTLINGSLIQAAAVGSDGSIQRCKIHPLMQVLASSKAREEIYFQTDASSEIRHGTIFASTTSLTHFSNAPHLRSLLSFKPGGDISYKVLRSICWHSKLLKVLDLKGMNVKKLPATVGDHLWNLRYLNLRKTGIKSLPDSVGCLVRLLILDVRENSGLKRINVVKNLKNLRILLFDDSLESFKLGKLTQLRTLGWVRPEHLRRNDIAKNNGNLEVLKVIIHDSSKFEEFVKALFNLVHLSNLPSSSVTGFCNMKKLKRLLLKVRMSEPERPPNTARGFYLLPEELATLPDFSISTLFNRSIEESGLLADSGHGFHPHIYIEYL